MLLDFELKVINLTSEKNEIIVIRENLVNFIIERRFKMIIVTRKQLNEKYAISKSQWDRRHDDLLEHLQDFMGIREIKSKKVLTLMR